MDRRPGPGGDAMSDNSIHANVDIASPTTEIIRYAAAVFEQDDVVEVRRIGKDSPAFSTWHYACELQEHVAKMEADNATRNIYVGANPRHDFRRRGDDNVPLARCLFVDFDHITIEDAMMRIDSVGLPAPTLVVSSGHGAHAYWRLNRPMTDLEQWTAIQKRLIAAVGSDKSIHNPERIMRLPGFQNLKPPAALAFIVTGDATNTYGLDTLCSIIPEAPKSQRTTPAPANRMRNEDDATHWLNKALSRVLPGNENGSGRNSVGHWLAMQLRDAGMSITEAEGVMRRYQSTVPQDGDSYTVTEAMNSLRSAFESPRREPARANGTRQYRPAPRATNATADDAGSENLADFELTDLGNGERLIFSKGHLLRYCPTFSRWYIWTGKRWQLDDTGAVDRLAKQVVRATKDAANDMGDKKRAEQVWKHANQSESNRSIKNMLERASKEDGVCITSEELDADAWLFNVENATIDLRTGKPQHHHREDYITRISPVSFDPAAQCPLTLATLDRLFQGNTRVISFIQRSIGYSLTGITSERVLFIWHGSGANGKSTMLSIFRELLGEFAVQIPADSLMVRRSGSIPNDIAMLKGSRLVSATESEDGQKLAESLVKQLTGGEDEISARFMRQEWFSFKPTFKIYLASNHKPNIKGRDPAIWGRIRLVPFNVVIPEAERDKELANKLRAELPGILNWAIQGCLNWQREGLGTPAEVQQATAAYQSDQDVVGAFLADRCTTVPNGKPPIADATPLYQAYVAWAKSTGEDAVTQKQFGGQLAEKGFESGRDSYSGRAQWKGVGLLSSEPSE